MIREGSRPGRRGGDLSRLARVDFIIHGGGPLVIARGAGYEDMIVRDVEAAAKVKATTSIRAGHGGRSATSARAASPSLRPYPKRHNDALTGHLTINGFEVGPRRGMDLPFKEMQNLPPADIPTFAGNVLAAAKDCDALYLPCPQWQGLRRSSSNWTGQRQARGCLYACLLLRRIQIDGHE